MRPLTEYRIIIPSAPSFNERRASAVLQESIKLVCGKKIPIFPDSESAVDKELAVGKTTREAGDGVVFARSSERLWEHEIRTVGERVYLTGLGLPLETEPPYNTAYRHIDDGAFGTVFAAYRFVEDVLGYDFLCRDFDGFPENPEACVPEGYTRLHTKEFFAGLLPEKTEGAVLYSIPSCSLFNWNMTCFILKTAENRIVVIDSGHEADAEHIVQCLEALSDGRKPVVSAWLFSHLHEDHYGTLKVLCEKSELAERVTVENFYCHLLAEEFYTKLSKEASANFKQPYDALIGIPEKLGAGFHTVEPGDLIAVDELKFEVIHVPSEEFMTQMNMNDSSVVYRLDYNGEQSILFLADSEWVCSNDLLLNHADRLPSDVVQVGHHGCGSVSFDCYKAIGAKAYIWQIGEKFLYSDCGEGLNTHNTGVIRTRAYLKQLGAKKENTYTDTEGILTLKLPVEIK